MRAEQLTANIRVSSGMLLLKKAFPIRNSNTSSFGVSFISCKAQWRGCRGVLAKKFLLPGWSSGSQTVPPLVFNSQSGCEKLDLEHGFIRGVAPLCLCPGSAHWVTAALYMCLLGSLEITRYCNLDFFFLSGQVSFGLTSSYLLCSISFAWVCFLGVMHSECSAVAF